MLDQHEFDLAGCIEDAVALLAEDAHKKCIELNLYIHGDVVASAVGDSGRLRQVSASVGSSEAIL